MYCLPLFCIISFCVTAILCVRQDVSDLFGCDLPVEGGKSVRFAWRDGPLLKALKAGDWVLLDEVSTVTGSHVLHY